MAEKKLIKITDAEHEELVYNARITDEVEKLLCAMENNGSIHNWEYLEDDYVIEVD